MAIVLGSSATASNIGGDGSSFSIDLSALTDKQAGDVIVVSLAWAPWFGPDLTVSAPGWYFHNSPGDNFQFLYAFYHSNLAAPTITRPASGGAGAEVRWMAATFRDNGGLPLTIENNSIFNVGVTPPYIMYQPTKLGTIIASAMMIGDSATSSVWSFRLNESNSNNNFIFNVADNDGVNPQFINYALVSRVVPTLNEYKVEFFAGSSPIVQWRGIVITTANTTGFNLFFD